MQNLTGFRDPYAFQSPVIAKMLQGVANNATGPTFLTISGGIRADSGQSGTGPRLMLYRQTAPNDWLHWTYLGPLVSPSGQSSFSAWSGNFGINFETSGVTRLNVNGMAYDDGSDARALNIVGLGTEQGRNGSHENHWPLCEFFVSTCTHY
jgi:beta-fructofuranosidase